MDRFISSGYGKCCSSISYSCVTPASSTFALPVTVPKDGSPELKLRLATDAGMDATTTLDLAIVPDPSESFSKTPVIGECDEVIDVVMGL